MHPLLLLLLIPKRKQVLRLYPLPLLTLIWEDTIITTTIATKHRVNVRVRGVGEEYFLLERRRRRHRRLGGLCRRSSPM